jgi:uncharacterized protein involved in exopolysaccharide biosynthesis
MNAGETRTEGVGSYPQSAYSLSDVWRGLMREIWLILAVFFVLLAIGIAIAFMMPKTYTASASLVMKLGQDYVYVPAAGDAARGAAATTDEVVQSEVEILNSTELKRRIINELGYNVFVPTLPKDYIPKTVIARQTAENAALKVITQHLKIDWAPKSNIVRLSYKNEDAQKASLILNTLLDNYKKYRLEVFSDVTAPMLEVQKAAFDRRLREADNTYENFLQKNGVGDFQSAKTTYSKLYDTITGEIYLVDALLAQAKARHYAVTVRFKQLVPEISTERNLDLSVPTKLLALRTQREELLARYTPEAQPVRDLNEQIGQLEAMMASGTAIGEKDHKIGVNPIYQQLLADKLQLEAEIAAQSGRRDQLKSQADQVVTKLQSLTTLDGEFTTLDTERQALQNNVRNFTARIQENRAANEIAAGGTDTVRVINRASPPDKPTSFKTIILIFTLLFAAFTAICVGLVRFYLRKGFVGAPMASRTLGLPILAQAGYKRA